MDRVLELFGDLSSSFRHIPPYTFRKMSSFIKSFKSFPRQLFRVNNGWKIALREWSPERQKSYDLLTEAENLH